MLDDIMIPFIVDKFHEMGFAKVWDPDNVVLIYDHLVPNQRGTTPLPFIAGRRGLRGAVRH